MKFLYCVKSNDSRRNSRKHRKSPRRRRRNSRNSYMSPSITKRSNFYPVENPSGIRSYNKNAFHHHINDYNAIDINAMNHQNSMNYMEMGMGVPSTIYENKVYSNYNNSSQKLHSNLNHLFKNSKIYPNTGTGHLNVVNQHFQRGNVMYTGIEKKRRKKVSCDVKHNYVPMRLEHCREGVQYILCLIYLFVEIRLRKTFSLHKSTS